MTSQPAETLEDQVFDEMDDAGDDDTLTHRVCPHCEIRDQVKGIPPAALCGKRKYGWVFAKPGGPNRQCVVCEELKPAGCPGCGFQWPVVNL